MRSTGVNHGHFLFSLKKAVRYQGWLDLLSFFFALAKKKGSNLFLGVSLAARGGLSAGMETPLFLSPGLHAVGFSLVPFVLPCGKVNVIAEDNRFLSRLHFLGVNWCNRRKQPRITVGTSLLLCTTHAFEQPQCLHTNLWAF